MLVGGIATSVAAHGLAAGATARLAALASRSTGPNATGLVTTSVGSTAPSLRAPRDRRSSSASSNGQTRRLADPIAMFTNAAEEASCLHG